MRKMDRLEQTLSMAWRAMVALMAFWAIGPGPASAQSAAATYPNRPIKIIVPVTPGAGVDNGARMLAEKLREAWGQPVLVENRPGANTIIGTTAVARAAPDGYTLLFVANSHVILPLIASKLPYDANNDFAPVASFGYTPYLLLVHPAVPAQSLQQFIAYARSKPGELNFGSSGVGAGSHMAGEVFNAMTGVRMQHVPYKGGGQAMTELMGGQIQVSWNTVNAAAPHIKSGRVRALAVSGDARAAPIPDVPTFAEAGLPDYQETAWLGLFAPAGTPRPIIDKLSGEVSKMLRAPGMKESFEAQGLVPFISTPEQFADMLRKQTATLAPVVKAANIRMEGN